jgi:hypothetical protein
MCFNPIIERKIALASDACSKPPTIIRSHDLHAGDIRRAVGEITSYHEKLALSFFLVFGPFELCVFWLFCWPPLFCLPWDGYGHRFFFWRSARILIILEACELKKGRNLFFIDEIRLENEIRNSKMN